MGPKRIRKQTLHLRRKKRRFRKKNQRRRRLLKRPKRKTRRNHQALQHQAVTARLNSPQKTSRK